MARERFTGTFDADDLEWLGEEADRRGISIAELLRRLVKDARDRSESETTLEERVEALEKEVFGRHLDADARERVETLTIDRVASTPERVDSLAHVYQRLREEGSMSKGEVLELADEQQTGLSPSSWYEGVVAELAELEEIKKPKGGGQRWRFVE